MGEQVSQNGSTETCPKRIAERGPDTHQNIVMVEQPTDVSAFFVQRCADCDEILYSCETEEEYLEEYAPEDGKEEHSEDFGGLF